MSDNDSRQALQDIETIKAIVESSNASGKVNGISVSAHKNLNELLLPLVVFFTVYEVSTGRITADFMASAQDHALQVQGLIQTGVAVLVLYAFAKIFLMLEARDVRQNVNSYAARYFSYFEHVKGLSDLTVKFAAFALIILAGKPEWIAPFLTLCLADLTFQRSLFSFSVRVSFCLGCATLAVSLAAFAYDVASVVLPLAVAAFLLAFNTITVFAYTRSAE